MLELSNEVRVTDEEIEHCHRRLKFLLTERVKHFCAQLITCKYCHNDRALGEWSFRQAYWYEAPVGPLSGNVWHTDDRHSRIVGPECAAEFRMHFLKYDQQELILAHRNLFQKGADIEDRPF
jgi:hypothetical protein